MKSDDYTLSRGMGFQPHKQNLSNGQKYLEFSNKYVESIKKCILAVLNNVPNKRNENMIELLITGLPDRKWAKKYKKYYFFFEKVV